MNRFVFALFLLSSFLYPSLMSFLGINEQYEDGQDNLGMVLFIAFTGFGAILFTLKDFAKYIRRVHPFFYWVPLLFVADFAIETLFMSGEVYTTAFKAFQIFLVYSVPAIFIGANVAYEDELMKTFKFIHLFTIVISVGILISIPQSLTIGRVVLGSTNYQEISYMSAFSVGVLLYKLLFKPNFVFPFLKENYFKYIEIFLLIVLGVNVFLSGGRGGVLLLIVNIVVIFVLYFETRKMLAKGLLYVGIVFLILIPIIGSVIASNDELSAIFEYGFGRAFEYVSESGGLDLEGASDRDLHYKWAVERIGENAFGYGFFRSYGLFIYPHNFFLEVVLDGGIIYLSFVILISVFCFNKLKMMIKENVDFYCFIPLVTYPVVMLFFSSTYKHCGMFWFCLSFIMSYIIRSRELNNETNAKYSNNCKIVKRVI